jgi:hypothetical protein
MTTKIPSTQLGTIAVVGGLSSNAPLWRIEARARRVPLGRGNNDGNTPGSHGLRTTWIRSVPRNLVNGTARDYLDPVSEEAFISAQDEKTSKVSLEIAGVVLEGVLLDEQVAELSPFSPHPAAISENIHLPPYLIAQGALRLEEGALAGLFEGKPKITGPVWLEPKGVVFTVEISQLAPQKPDIPTFVRLQDAGNGQLMLELLDDAQPATGTGDTSWDKCLAQIRREFSSSTRRTAWLRVDLQLGSRLPRLSWSVSVTSDKKLKIDETVVRLPSGVAKLWLADQPIESQLLPPRRVLQLVPTAPQLKVGNDGVLTLAWESKKGLKGISYEWNGSNERFAFDDLPMVHQPSEVLAQLGKLYSAGQQGENATETAFVREQRGWLELPITVPANPPFLPQPVSSELTKLAAGGLLLGRRRSDLLRPNTIPSEVPWSIEVDVPRDFSFELKFDIRKPAELSLVQAQVTLAGSAVRMTGGLWIAGRRPDADDALPRVEPEPDAFIPLDMASCALESMDAAPFVMKRLAVTAPSLNGKIEWDDPSMRWERAPSLAPSSGIIIWPHRLDAKRTEVRGWFRHPTLPTIQTMPITRSDLTSTLPHASRGLDFFESKADQVLLVGIDGLQPRLNTQSRESFTKPAVTTTSAALSLPGVEIERPTATTSLYSGHFSLPVCIEQHARAGVPADDGAKEEIAAPVVTARDRMAFLELVQDRVRISRLAATGESMLFPPAAAHTKTNVAANSLAPPRTWNATATLDDVVHVAKGLSLGSISFEQGTTWKWTAAGDELLRGVYAKADLGTQDKVTLSKTIGSVPVVGWSLAETPDGSLGPNGAAVRDGHGIAWGTTLRRDGLVKRSLRQEHGEVAGELLSTSPSAPIHIDWPGEPNLRLAFTDLHVPISQKEWTASAQSASDTALATGWTWSLFEDGKPEIRSLKLLPAYCFAPAALRCVTFDAARQAVVGCVFEGALGLGIESQLQPNDARARVRIVLEADRGGRLFVKSVEVSPANEMLEWELRERLESFGTRSARLSALPDWQVRQGLQLSKPKLAMRMLGSAMELEMAHDELDVLKMEQSVQTSAKLAVDSARVDLKTGRLVRLSLSVELREGVVVHATDDEGLDYATGSLDWFGNSIKFNNVIVDPVLRAFTFTRPAEVDVVVAPGVETGKLETASVAFSTAGFGNGGFAIVALFAEVLVKGAFGPEVAASHLLLKDSGREVRDELRLDGRHKCKSAIPWPEVSVPEFPAKAVSVEVEFGEGGRVSHWMDLHYSDHRIPGDRLGWKAGVPGILLKEAPKDSGKPAATWLVEASHSLAWTSAESLGFTTAGPVQLWSASKLAAAIRTLGDKYTFIASYRGTDTSVPDFPEPGVRRVRLALAGLFDGEVAKALIALGEAWVIVGSGSFLVPREGDASTHLHVHLPFLHSLSGDPAELEKSLAPKLQPGHTKQRLSRHDVLPTSLRLASDTVMPLGDFIEPLEDAVPFTASFAPEQALRGSQLERGFFFEKDKGVTTQLEVCWHVEQFRREGASAAAKEALFRFPRAAVMLARLRFWQVPKRPEVLSILVAHNADKARTRVMTVSTAHRQSLQSRVDRHYNTDLVVGSGTSVVRIPLVNQPGTTATDQRALLHFVLDRVSAPLFAVLRTFAPQRSHLAIELPRTKPPAVLPASFLQRAAKGFCFIDGRRTWPEPVVLPKEYLGVVVKARSHETDSSRLSVGVRGVVHAPRLASAAFQVGANEGATVWLQRQDEVAFAVGDLNVEDAAPVGTAGARLVRPLVPSTHALGDALLRMDPLLKDKLVQSLLPPSLSDIDRSNRVGAFSIARTRVLLGGGGLGKSATTIAFAGPSAVRWLRLPRPLPLPPNSGGNSSEWRRTLGWYGEPKTSCVVRAGRWAGLQGQPAKADSAPSWFLLVGCPEPQQVGSQASGPVWHGALRVRCTRINGERNAAPALLALLRNQVATANAALHCGTRRVAFTIVSLEGEWLTFKPAPDSSSTPIPPDAECTFELSLDVKDALPAGESGEVELKPAESCTLRPVSYHTISIKVTPPRARAYPLPLVVRSIFFDDPEYDLALSKVEPANAYVMARDGITRYQLWVDRRYVTPGETIVVRVDSVANSGSNLNPDSNPDTTFEMNLFARVKRWGASEFVKLNFRLGISFKESVVLKRGVMVSLPLSDLVDSNNAQGGTLAVGDLLQLQAFKGDLAVTLYFIVKTRSGLPTPEAMYSLIAFDPKAEERAPESPEDVAWTALHSSCPAAETLNAYQVDDGSELKLVRRGHFRWECTEAYGPDLKFALMKTHLPSESTHIPDQAEAERVQGAGMLWQLD